MDKRAGRDARRAFKPQDWRYTGEVDARSRPLNSLVSEANIEYEKAEDVSKLCKKEDTRILRLMKQRVREQNFDNFDYGAFVHEKQPLCNTEVHEDKEVDRDEIEKLFLEVKAELDVLSNIGGLWCNADIKVYKEKPAELPAKKAGNRVHKRDKASMKVLRRAKNVKILK